MAFGQFKEELTMSEKVTKKKLHGAAAMGAGPGRPKGVPNKNTALIRDMIAQALEQAGGVQYLADTAISHPAAFLALIGKVMPVQITGEGGGPVSHSLKVEFVSGKAA